MDKRLSVNLSKELVQNAQKALGRNTEIATIRSALRLAIVLDKYKDSAGNLTIVSPETGETVNIIFL